MGTHDRRQRRAERGATSTEYALMASLIAVAIAGAVGGVGGAVVDLFSDVDLLNAL
jgi:Flp pilus assembly pilin Flp